MPHIDPERLALFAIGEPSRHARVRAPRRLPVCVDDLAALRHAAVAGRASFDVGELEAPPEAVWSRIVDELALGTKPPSPRLPASAETRRGGRAAPSRHDAHLGAGRLARAGRRRRPRRLGRDTARGTDRVAEATLAPFPDHPSAEGSAVVEEGPTAPWRARRTERGCRPRHVPRGLADHRRRIGTREPRRARRQAADLPDPVRMST
jgi:hypothetical protein